MRRKILRGLALAFLIAVFATTAASLALRFTLNPNLLRTEITSRLLAWTGRDAGLGQASVSLMSGLVIKDFYLLDPPPSDEESVSFERAIVGVSLWDLLHQRLRVKTLDLRSPHIELIIEPDGTTNFADLLAHLRGEGRSAAASTSSEHARESRIRDEGERSADPQGDEAEGVSIGSIRVENGSITVNRYAVNEEDDRYLDVTDLAVAIDNFSTQTPFTIQMAGNLGVERQSSFTLRGQIDPATRRFEGDLEIPRMRASLVNSLLEFGEIVSYHLEDGDVRRLKMHIRTGENLRPVDIEGEVEMRDVEAAVGKPRLRLDGRTTLRASYEPGEDTLTLSRFDMDINRPGEDGEVNIIGQVKPRRGEADLRLQVTGLAADTIQGAFPLPVQPRGQGTWIDSSLHLVLRDGFLRGSVEGDLNAKALEVALPALLEDDVKLDGLALQASVNFDLASEEFAISQSLWSLPGVVPPSNPVALVGSSATGLGLALPSVDVSALGSRLVAPGAPSTTLEQLATEIALSNRAPTRGIPVRVSIPHLVTPGGEWNDIEGTLRLGVRDLTLENVHGHTASGEFTVNGQTEKGSRRGRITARRLSLDDLQTLWGLRWPGEVRGLADGDFGGAIGQGGALSEAALDGTIVRAAVTEQWILEELADFTGLEEVRRWEGATVTLQAACDAGGWRLMNVSLRQPTARLRLGGRLYEDERIELAAVVSVPPATANQRARDPLFADPIGGDDGWSSICIRLTGTESKPILSRISRAQGDEIMASAREQRVAAIFDDLGVALPEGLDIVAPPPESVTPPSPPAPAVEPPEGAAPLPGVEQPSTQPPQPLPAPEVAPPSPLPPEIEPPPVLPPRQPREDQAPPPRGPGQRRREAQPPVTPTPPAQPQVPPETPPGERPSEIVP